MIDHLPPSTQPLATMLDEAEPSGSAKPSNSLLVLSSDDNDDEAVNEYLSLKIVEKALLMRATKLVPGAAADDYGDAGVLNGTQGAIDGGGNGSSSSVLEGEVVESPSGRGRKVIVPFGSNKKIVKKKKKIEKMEVQDQSIDRLLKRGSHSHGDEVSSSSSSSNNCSAVAIDSSNIGFQLLKKHGWKEGTGLGASQQGRLEPVQAYLKNNKRGLGADKVKKTAKKPHDTDASNEKNDRVVVVNDKEEEETVEALNMVELVDPNVVEKTDNIVFRKLLRGPRYFDPPDSGWRACFNCGEEGHTVANCTAAKRKKPCFVCGSLEHNAKQCSKGQNCFICKKSGHRAKDCPKKYKGGSLSLKTCLKCGDSGHDMFSCWNDYSPNDLKAFFPFPSFIPKETQPVILPFFFYHLERNENQKHLMLGKPGRYRNISG